ncbi:hypothetical protein [Glutamicibacter ardleyensis]|uniref:hypothetical protein n=1 Tax=Glutamicibacter ardleyensis TaxID=225894 RepID=UPI003FD1CF91
MKRTNLRSQNITKQRRQVQTYGTQTPLSSAAVERGSTRWLNGSTVVIEGLLDVTGTINGRGTNNFSGTNNLSGTNKLTGPTTVAGNFEIIAGGLFKAGSSLIRPDGSAEFGAFKIAPDGTATAGLFELRPDGSANFGTLEILADGTLNVNNDVNVLSGGKIKVGTNMTLTPSADGGSILFQDGSKVTSVGGVVRMIGAGSGAEIRASLNAAQFQVGSTVMGIDSAGDWFMQSSGTTFMSIGSTASLTGALDVSGKLTVGNSVLFTGLQVQFTGIPTTANKPNVHISGTGFLYKSTFDPAAA